MMKEAIQLALKEDIGDGDHTSLSTVPAKGTAATSAVLCRSTAQHLLSQISLDVSIVERCQSSMCHQT